MALAGPLAAAEPAPPASPAPANAAAANTAPTAAALESVVVTARKFTVETLIDRKVYNVATDLQASFGTVSDLLSSLPSVDVDPDGNVSLRGDGNVLILIDGKPSPQFSGSAAGDNLQSISSSNIERIEVITTPPAQFKADGAAGVINIITRKKRPQGMAGTLQASAGSGGRASARADASYQDGPLTLSADAGLRHDYRLRVLSSDVVAPDATTGLPSESRSVLNERLHREVPAASITAGYAIDEQQTLEGSAAWSRRGGLRTYTQADTGGPIGGPLTSATLRQSRGHDPENSSDEKLSYTRKLATPGEQLDLSLHQSASHQLEHYDYADTPLLPAGPTVLSNLQFGEDQTTTEFGADYALPVSSTQTVKLGYAFEQDDYRFNTVGTSFDASGVPAVNPNVTNAFRFGQWINAAYASYQKSAGAWNALAGLRAELTRTQAQQLSNAVSLGSGYRQLFPSLHVERSLSEEQTLSFGASRRVSRPDPSLLNPYVDYEYTPNLRAGNARLQPQYTQSYEAGYGVESKGLTYQFTGYYRRNRDSVTDVTQYLGNGLSLTTKTNLPRNDAAGLEITANGHLAASLAYSLSANLFHSQIDASALGLPGLQSSNGVNGKFKLDYRYDASDAAQFIVTRADKRLTPQGHVSAINLVNLGYRHTFSPSLSGTATLSDVFNGQRYRRTEATPLFTGNYERDARGRVLWVGLVYRFGENGKDKGAKFDYDQAN